MRSGFFNSEIIGTDENGMPIFDRAESSDFFAKFFSSLIPNGVLKGSFDLTANGMDISLSPGVAYINGYFGWEAQQQKFTFDSASSMIHRIIIRLDFNERTITFFIASGTVVPAPLRTEDIYDIVLYTINITAGQATISQANITDNRKDSDLCGMSGKDMPIDAATLGGKSASYFLSTSGKAADSTNLNGQPSTYYQKKITSGTGAPSGGSDGDIYIQV